MNYEKQLYQHIKDTKNKFFSVRLDEQEIASMKRLYRFMDWSESQCLNYCLRYGFQKAKKSIHENLFSMHSSNVKKKAVSIKIDFPPFGENIFIDDDLPPDLDIQSAIEHFVLWGLHSMTSSLLGETVDEKEILRLETKKMKREREIAQELERILQSNNDAKQEYGRRFAFKIGLQPGPRGRDNGVDGSAVYGSVKIHFQSKLSAENLGPDYAKVFFSDILLQKAHVGIYLAGGYTQGFKDTLEILKSHGGGVLFYILSLRDVLADGDPYLSFTSFLKNLPEHPGIRVLEQNWEESIQSTKKGLQKGDASNEDVKKASFSSALHLRNQVFTGLPTDKEKNIELLEKALKEIQDYPEDPLFVNITVLTSLLKSQLALENEDVKLYETIDPKLIVDGFRAYGKNHYAQERLFFGDFLLSLGQSVFYKKDLQKTKTLFKVIENFGEGVQQEDRNLATLLFHKYLDILNKIE